MGTGDEELVDLRWIADTAVVGASTVSNWRKRDQGFPRRAGGTNGRPLFSKAEVLEWGRLTGRLGAETSIGEVTSSEHARAILAVMRAHVPPRQFQTMAVLVFAHIEQVEIPAWAETGKRKDSQLGEFSTLDETERGVVEAVVADVEPILAGKDRSEIFEELVAQLAEKEFDQLSSLWLARSMLAFARGNPEVVLDPAAGIGTVLLEAAERFHPRMVFARDLEVDALLVLWMRFRLRGLPVHIERADALKPAFDDPSDLRADLVLLDLPFADVYNRRPASTGSSPASTLGPDQQWVRAATSRLSHHGVAVVHMLAASGGDTRGVASRTDMVLSGALQAVVALPSGMVSGVDHRLLTELWILSPTTRAAAPTVRMIDASLVDLDLLPAALAELVSDHPIAEQGEVRWADVDRFEILRNSAILTPSRWIGSRYSAEAAQADLAAIGKAISGAKRDLLPLQQLSLRMGAASAAAEAITVGDLLNARRLMRVRSGASSVIRSTSDLVDAQVVTGKVLRGTEGADSQRVDERTLLQPGDVVVSEIGKPVVRVWTERGWAVGSAVIALRVVDRSLDPEYLRVVLSSPIAEAIGLKGNKLHFDPQLVPIPILSREEQTAIVQEASALEHAIASVNGAGLRLAEAHRALTKVAAAGFATPSPDTSTNAAVASRMGNDR